MKEETAEAAAALLAGIKNFDRVIAALQSAIAGRWTVKSVVLSDPKDGSTISFADDATKIPGDFAVLIYTATLDTVQKERATLAAQLEALQ